MGISSNCYPNLWLKVDKQVILILNYKDWTIVTETREKWEIGQYECLSVNIVLVVQREDYV